MCWATPRSFSSPAAARSRSTRLLLPRLEPSGRHVEKAMPILRVALGLTLVVLSFTEKLLNLDLAEAFLKQHPVNFMRYFGSSMTDRTFAVCAGSVELTVGLLLVFGFFPRVVIFLAWLPLNMTLMVFNWSEVIGHLPFYGGLAMFLFWTPSQEDARLFRRGVRELLLPLPNPLPATPDVRPAVVDSPAA
jgi:uncharacterized membrane protein YphA (DoxX/SURF4 family)